MKNPVSHHHFDDFESTLRLAVAHGVEHHVGMRGLTSGARETTFWHPVPHDDRAARSELRLQVANLEAVRGCARTAATASVGDPAPSCGPIAGLRAVPPGLQTPSRPLKMVHRAARSRRVITPATTTSRPMTPTMNPRVGAGWGVVTTTDVPHRHADSRVHYQRVTRGCRAEKTRPNPAENSTCAPNTISSLDFGCAWPGLRAAGRDFFFAPRRNPYLLAKTRRGLYRMLKSIQKHPASHKTAFFSHSTQRAALREAARDPL